MNAKQLAQQMAERIVGSPYTGNYLRMKDFVEKLLPWAHIIEAAERAVTEPGCPLNELVAALAARKEAAK